MSALLRAQALTERYGKLVALDGVSFETSLAMVRPRGRGFEATTVISALVLAGFVLLAVRRLQRMDVP
ncbi:MAG TPA: hypothetical protein VFQ22_04275 [Longimicrobiales bacterium]|nr:hypothetical protein [Longimicrobiales bacterium]